MPSTPAPTPASAGRGPAAPTVRQVFALAAALCEKVGEPFPDRRDDASDLIARVRREIGHPSPELPPRHRTRGGRGARRLSLRPPQSEP